MDTNALAIASRLNLFAYNGDNKNLKSSINIFLEWCVANGYTWQTANLMHYRQYALQRWNPPSAKKHMQRIRNRYREILMDNRVRDYIQELVPEGASPADAYAITEEIITRLRNIVEDKTLIINMPTLTAQLDSKFRWLTRDEVMAAIESIPTTMPGLRDRAMIALAFTYGLRSIDMQQITIDDLLQTVGGAGGVQVPVGKGQRQRFVFYMPQTDLLHYVQEWMDNAGMADGYVLRALTPQGKVTERKMQADSIGERYNVNGLDFNPHDMRRSAARIWYDATLNLEFVRQQLGHVHPEQTVIYLGLLRPTPDGLPMRQIVRNED